MEIAENGKIACDMHGINFYDVILMDVQMPVMDGMEATKFIREYEKQQGLNRKVKIFDTTANTMKKDRQKCLDADMDDYISKPFKAIEPSKIPDKAFNQNQQAS